MVIFLYGGFGIIQFIAPIFIFIVFIILISTIILRTVKGAKQWNVNNASPVLTVDAKVVSKRADVQLYDSVMENANHLTSSTTYFATFEVDSGDRLEFKISDLEYGMVVEEDSGKLTFQGTRYLGFKRN